METTRRKVFEKFLSMHGSSVSNKREWEVILEDTITMRTPVTLMKPFKGRLNDKVDGSRSSDYSGEVDPNSRTITGIFDVISDSLATNVMINAIGCQANEVSRSSSEK